MLDNFFHEAYPNVFYTAMLPAMRAVLRREGENETDPVPFEVRNHAMGNNPCYAYDACIATHLGEDLDILTWEQVERHFVHVLCELTEVFHSVHELRSEQQICGHIRSIRISHAQEGVECNLPSLRLTTN